ncbi:rhodanese-like domain-containing protein [Pseudogracilibacillus sp. SE30717A]|uniref:rhodanese-like domain-containing protein n=1 Tax=Pseudogracilibacillus sp. SE30717A TaxID=3098293 RepID=UPI00300DF1E3
MSLDVIKFLVSIIFALLVLIKILPGRGINQITANDLRKQLKDESIQFIDVRPPAKYDQFHIYGFKNIPLREIRKQAKTLSKDKQTIVICQTGAKGNEACKRLKRRGFTNLSNVRGGLSTWEPIHIDRT